MCPHAAQDADAARQLPDEPGAFPFDRDRLAALLRPVGLQIPALTRNLNGALETIPRPARKPYSHGAAPRRIARTTGMAGAARPRPTATSAALVKSRRLSAPRTPAALAPARLCSSSIALMHRRHSPCCLRRASATPPPHRSLSAKPPDRSPVAACARRSCGLPSARAPTACVARLLPRLLATSAAWWREPRCFPESFPRKRVRSCARRVTSRIAPCEDPCAVIRYSSPPEVARIRWDPVGLATPVDECFVAVMNPELFLPHKGSTPRTTRSPSSIA